MNVSMSIYSGAWDARPTKPVVGSWAQFVAGLQRGLQHTTPEPKDDTDEAWREAKESLPGFVCAAFAGRRRNANAGPHTAIVIDVDDVPNEAELIAKLERWRCVAYESPSSGCRGKGLRLRVCVALTQPVPPHAVKAARSAFARELGLDPRLSGVDKANAASQIMFLGRVGGTPERQLHSFEGKPWTPPEPGVEPAKRDAGEHAAQPRYAAEHVPDLTVLAEAIAEPGPDGRRRGGMALMRGVGGYLARLGYHPDAIEAACAVLPSDQPDVRAEQARSCAEQYYDGSELAAGRTALVEWFGEELVAKLDWAVDDWTMRLMVSWPPPRPSEPATVDSAEVTGISADDALAALPEWVSNHVRAAQEELRTPLGLNLANAIGALACATSGRLKLRLTATYTCHTCMFMCSVASSGQLKSPAFRLASAPIKAWVAEKQDAEREGLQEKLNERELKTRKKKKLIDEQLANWAEYDNPPLSPELTQISVELAAPAPVPFEFLVQDVTPEALSDLLATHGRIACLSSEAAKIFSVLAGHYSGVADLGVWNEAYDGEMKEVHRKDKTKNVKPLCAQTTLSAVLSIQPSVLESITGNSAMAGEGLVQRMGWVVCDDAGARWAPGEEPDPVPQDVAETWDAGVRFMLDLPTQEVKLSLEARPVYLAWRDELEVRKKTDLGGEMLGWQSKHLERTARIAAILWAADGASETSPAVTAEQMGRAVVIGRWLISHAIKAIQGGDATSDEASILACVARRAERTGDRRAWVLRRELQQHVTPKRLRRDVDKVLMPRLKDLVGRGALEADAGMTKLRVV